MSREPSSILSQPDKMDRARVGKEKDSSDNSPKSTCRSVSEEAKGEVFLKLLLSVSSAGLPREEDYGTLSPAERADVDRRVLRVRNNIAMKALKAELKRLRRRKSARKHQSFPVGVTELADSTIHEEEEALVGSRPPSSLPADLGEGEDEVDGETTDNPPHRWKGANQKRARLSRRTEEVDSAPACTPSSPSITPPLQTSQTKQSVQRVDSAASSRSTDSGYTSDRGVNMANRIVGRAVLEDLTEGEESTPSSNHSVLILNPGLSQGDLQAERDGSSATPILSAEKEDVFASSFKRAMKHQVRVEEHTSTAYNEKGQVVGATKERRIEETTSVTVSGVSSWESSMEVQLNEEELSMASNDEEVRYLRQLKCRYQAEFSNVMEFQELMKTLRRPPTLSDFLAFKLKYISDRCDTDYDAPINNAVSMIVSGSVEKGLSDSFFSSAVEPLLHQAKKVPTHTTSAHEHTDIHMRTHTDTCVRCGAVSCSKCSVMPCHEQCARHIPSSLGDSCQHSRACSHHHTVLSMPGGGARASWKLEMFILPWETLWLWCSLMHFSLNRLPPDTELGESS